MSNRQSDRQIILKVQNQLSGLLEVCMSLFNFRKKTKTSRRKILLVVISPLRKSGIVSAIFGAIKWSVKSMEKGRQFSDYRLAMA